MAASPEDPTVPGRLLRSLGLSDSVIVPLRVGSEMIGALVLLGLMDTQGIETIVHSLDRLSFLLALIMRQADQYRDLELAVRERTAELRATRDRLEEQHAFLSSLLASLPNPVFVQDMHGRILRCNDAFTALVESPSVSLSANMNPGFGTPLSWNPPKTEGRAGRVRMPQQ